MIKSKKYTRHSSDISFFFWFLVFLCFLLFSLLLYFLFFFEWQCDCRDFLEKRNFIFLCFSFSISWKRVLSILLFLKNIGIHNFVVKREWRSDTFIWLYTLIFILYGRYFRVYPKRCSLTSYFMAWSPQNHCMGRGKSGYETIPSFLSLCK